MIMLVREWSTLYRADIPRILGKHEITRESASAWLGHCVRHHSPQPPSRHAHNGAKAWALGCDKAECDARFITHYLRCVGKLWNFSENYFSFAK